MCMLYVVRPATESDRARMSRGDRALALEWGIFDEGGPALSLHGCDMVRDWDRPSGWKLAEKYRTKLHADFGTIFREFPGTLEVTAAWATDPVDEEMELERDDF